MSQLYTSGRWTVVPGQEEEFVKAWSELAEWTSAEVPGNRWATLLQHQEEPNLFLSFGPWESAEAVAAWRESPGFHAASTRLANPDGSTRDRDFNKAPRCWPTSATAGGAVSFAERLIRAPDRLPRSPNRP